MKNLDLNYINSNHRKLSRSMLMLTMIILLLGGSGQVLRAQACVAPDYNVVATKQMITLSSTAVTNGAGGINVLKDGNNTNNNFWFNFQNATGVTYILMQFPSPTIVKGIDLAMGTYLFNSNGFTELQASNDNINWTPLVTKDHAGSTNACMYGTCPTAETWSFESNEDAYLYYRIRGTGGTSRSTPFINELYFLTAPIETAGLADVTCNPGADIFDVADDFITFELNPTGGSGTYNVSVSGATVMPMSAAFGAPTTFTLPAGTAGGGDLNLSITGFDSDCTLTETITDPGSCLPGSCGELDWNDPAVKSTIVGVFDLPENSGHSGTIENILDSDQSTVISTFTNDFTERPIFTFQFPQATILEGIELNIPSNENEPITAGVFRIEGSNDGTNYVSVSGNFTYGSNLNAGAPQYGGAGTLAYTFPFAANTTAYSYYRIYAVSINTRFGRDFTEVYFDYLFFDPQITNQNCNDNGTFENYTDDLLTFDLNPIPGNPGDMYSLEISGGFTITPTTGTYGQVTSFSLSPGSSGAGNLTLTLTDTNTPCVSTFLIENTENACIPGPCGDPDWNLLANKAQILSESDEIFAGTLDVMFDGVVGEVNNGDVRFRSATSNPFVHFTLTFPEATALTGFELAVESGESIYNNGCNTEIQAKNTQDATWTTIFTESKGLNTVNPCRFGDCPRALSWSFPGNTTPYTQYRLVKTSGQSRLSASVFEIFFDVSATFNAGLNNVSLDENGSPGFVDDDKILFELNPSSSNMGSYTVQAPNGFSINPNTANFGAATQFELSGPISGAGDITILVIDVNEPCVGEVVVPNPSFDITVISSQADCVDATDSPLGLITITGMDGEITKAEFNPGTQFAGMGFASAADVSNLSTGFDLVSNLPNPEFLTFYTVRAYASETLFRDFVVSLDRKPCSVATLSLSISPTTDSANEGEQLTYVVTLNNTGPNPAQNVAVRVDIPTDLEVLTSTAQLGEYSLANQLWTIDEVPIGMTTLTITYRMQ